MKRPTFFAWLVVAAARSCVDAAHYDSGQEGRALVPPPIDFDDQSNLISRQLRELTQEEIEELNDPLAERYRTHKRHNRHNRNGHHPPYLCACLGSISVCRHYAMVSGAFATLLLLCFGFEHLTNRFERQKGFAQLLGVMFREVSNLCFVSIAIRGVVAMGVFDFYERRIRRDLETTTGGRAARPMYAFDEAVSLPALADAGEKISFGEGPNVSQHATLLHWGENVHKTIFIGVLVYVASTHTNPTQQMHTRTRYADTCGCVCVLIVWGQVCVFVLHHAVTRVVRRWKGAEDTAPTDLVKCATERHGMSWREKREANFMLTYWARRHRFVYTRNPFQSAVPHPDRYARQICARRNSHSVCRLPGVCTSQVLFQRVPLAASHSRAADVHPCARPLLGDVGGDSDCVRGLPLIQQFSEDITVTKRPHDRSARGQDTIHRRVSVFVG